MLTRYGNNNNDYYYYYYYFDRGSAFFWDKNDYFLISRSLFFSNSFF